MRGVFCSADFIKNAELQRILAARVDVGRENSQWWTLATRGAGQIRALFCEVFTRLRIRLGHFKLPARPSTFLQSDFSLNRAEIERTRGHLYAHGICLDPSSRQISPKKTGFYFGLSCIYDGRFIVFESGDDRHTRGRSMMTARRATPYMV